ncbi:MAG: thioredoxin family protein [Phycisphaerales bacterium]
MSKHRPVLCVVLCGLLSSGLSSRSIASAQMGAPLRLPPVAPNVTTHGAMPPGAARPRAAPSAIAFEDDFAAGLARAKRENKPLLVEFMRPGCPFCARMESQVYVLPEAKALAESVVWVRVNQEKGDGPRLLRQFRTGATPSYVAVGHDGTSVYYRYSGALPAPGFLHSMSILQFTPEEIADPSQATASGELSRIPIDLHALEPLPAAASDGGSGLGGARESTGTRITPARLLALAKTKLMKGDIAAGTALLEQLVQVDPGNTSGSVDDALILLGQLEHADLSVRGADQAYADWLRILKEFPSSDRAGDAALYIMKVLRSAGHDDEANKLHALLKQYPANVDAKACLAAIEGT